MLKGLTVRDFGGGINLVDVGARAGLDPRWGFAEPFINLFAFEPDSEECDRLARAPNRYHSATYLAYALAGRTGRQTFYVTRQAECSSLLQPNLPWLKRFAFGELFEVRKREDIGTRRLDEVESLNQVDVDVIKVDTQGLDLAIIANGEAALAKCFYVEIEPGFTENYFGEYTYSQVDTYLRSKGFMLFDMKIHRAARRNLFSDSSSGQILWCDSVWLKDYISMASSGHVVALTRSKILKALYLCALENYWDYGYELAEFAFRRGLITETEFKELGKRDSWTVRQEDPTSVGRKTHSSSIPSFVSRAIGSGLRVLPWRVRNSIATELLKPNVVKSALRMLTGSSR